MSLKKLAERKSDLYHIDPRKIKAEENFNVRQDYDVDDLVDSIIENGVRQPLVVRVERKTGEIFLVDGHRRILAVNKAIEKGIDIKTVPAISETGNAEQRDLALILFNQHHALTPLEQGSVFKRLLNHGWSREQIKRSTGKTLGHISNCLALADMPQEVKSAVEGGEISSTLALDISRDNEGDEEKTKAEIKNAVTKAKAEGKSKATKKHTSKSTTTSKPKTGTTKMTAKVTFDKQSAIKMMKRAAEGLMLGDVAKRNEILRELEGYLENLGEKIDWFAQDNKS